MWKGNYLWERMMEHAKESADSVPYQTIIEIVGDQSVLIENHRGVITYGKEKVITKVKFGSVAVCGCNLEIKHMSREQLVISGSIQNISLQRR